MTGLIERGRRFGRASTNIAFSWRFETHDVLLISPKKELLMLPYSLIPRISAGSGWAWQPIGLAPVSGARGRRAVPPVVQQPDQADEHPHQRQDHQHAEDQREKLRDRDREQAATGLRCGDQGTGQSVGQSRG